ncbi:hypothetical protein Vretimale_12671 [Volvox reticuliferus]|uniref:Uncharacterized protein n=1 Tax=Volvox reticuliferus TaxID=1737510 RepID=A0A8J4GJV8_9CHLO|nr:hypothetical protein Vretifemale_142 [Volvox reticuliferus]GIM08669.1 hypothetical protein Vretimale_12671 [Volvox reticuliferus]
MRAVNLLGQQARHRTSFIDRNVPLLIGSRSVTGARAPCRLSQKCPSRSGAMAPPKSPTLWTIDTGCEDVMGLLRETEKLKTCLGVSLTDDEQRSLIKCLDSARLGVDTCLVDGLEALRNHMMSYIEAVAVSQTDDLELVEGAMLLVEQLSLALETTVVGITRGRSPPSPLSSSEEPVEGGASRREKEGPQVEARFSGQWQVLVTTGGGWPYGRLQYVPIIELLDISEDGQHFRLESKTGPLYMCASGQVTWRSGGSHHLHYQATEFRVELLGLSLALPGPAPADDLHVFALSPSTALARSALGGMQLMGRPG